MEEIVLLVILLLVGGVYTGYPGVVELTGEVSEVEEITLVLVVLLLVGGVYTG